MAFRDRLWNRFYEYSSQEWYGPCYFCWIVFGFRFHRVPLFAEQPVCSSCIVGLNQRRFCKGLPIIPVYPDSYIEASI